MSNVDEVRERTDIVALISAYTPLKKAGKTYKGLCPFHGEKTASFVVYPDEGRWHCFGSCAMGGDAFDFVMKADNLEFKGALEVLARRAATGPSAPQMRSVAAVATLGLTERQIQVLRLIARGASNKVICRELGLAERTVKAHVTAVFRALNVASRTQAALAAARLGLTPAGPSP